jgi:hypothetical protein
LNDRPTQKSQHNKVQQPVTLDKNESQATPAGITAATVTQEVILEMCEDMKYKFQNMIKHEVKTQIQEEISAIQTEMVNMSAKIDTLQDGIKDSVGQAIRHPQLPPSTTSLTIQTTPRLESRLLC